MFIIIVYIFSFYFGVLIQKLNKLYYLSFIGLILAFVFPSLISNSTFLDYIKRITNLSELNISVIVILYVTGTSISFLIFKIFKIRKMEKYIEYSDVIVDEKIQKLLSDIKAEFLKNERFYGKEIFISLFFVKRLLFNTLLFKIIRVAHCGLPSILTDKWDGIIENFKKSTTRSSVIRQEENLTIFKDIKEKELTAIPSHIVMWSKSNIRFRINIPFKKDNKVVFVVSINCLDKDLNISNINYSRKQILIQHSIEILQNYCSSIENLYNFFNCKY